MQNALSIGFVNKGCSKTEIYDKNYEVSSGTFLMIPYNMPHKCTSQNYNNWEFTMFYVDKEWFKEEFCFENIDLSYVNLKESMFLKIEGLFSEIEKNEMSMESECSLIKYISMFNHSELNYKKLPKISRIKKYLKDILRNIPVLHQWNIKNAFKTFLFQSPQRTGHFIDGFFVSIDAYPKII